MATRQKRVDRVVESRGSSLSGFAVSKASSLRSWAAPRFLVHLKWESSARIEGNIACPFFFLSLTLGNLGIFALRLGKAHRAKRDCDSQCQ